MKTNENAIGLFGLILIAGLAGCDPQPPAHTKATAPATPDAPAAPALPPKVDKVALADLQAGFVAMQPRITWTQEAYAPIKPVANNSRLFMHPLVDKDAAAEFDISGLSSVSLSPYIEDLSLDCARSPDAGVVSFSYALDDGAPVAVTVDRNYNELVKLDTSNAKTLKVAVNEGNGTNSCDWFSLGFVGVTNK